MKKMNFLSGVALLAIIGFSSCDKEVVSSPVSVDKVPRANITGYVTCELNLQKVGAESAPVGTKLFVEVNYADINGAAKGKWTDTVSVAADGRYEVAVPADADGVTVTITPFPFEADQTQAYEALFPTIKVSYTYPAVSFNIPTVKSGQLLSKDFVYISSTLPTFTDKVKISGKAQVNLDASIVGLESVPNGTIIVFFNDTWKDSIAVQNGLYSIEVPKSKTVYWKSKFKNNKNIWNTDNMTPSNSKYGLVNFEYTITGFGSFASNTINYNLIDDNSGEGINLTVDPDINVVKITGSVKADLDATTAGNEDAPTGIVITFYATDNSWGGTASVTSGSYSIKIPKNKNVQYYTTFTYDKKLTATPTYAKTTYTISGTISASNSSTATQNLIAL